jgi:hypothetical protein
MRDATSFPFTGPFFRTDEACAYLGYRGRHALRSLYRWIERNGVRTMRRSPRCILIRKSDIDQVIGAAHGKDSTREKLARHFQKSESRVAS